MQEYCIRKLGKSVCLKAVLLFQTGKPVWCVCVCEGGCDGVCVSVELHIKCHDNDVSDISFRFCEISPPIFIQKMP